MPCSNVVSEGLIHYLARVEDYMCMTRSTFVAAVLPLIVFRTTVLQGRA